MMAKIHNITATKKIDRVNYNSDVLLDKAYHHLNSFFSDDLNEMKYLKQITSKISKNFEDNFINDIVNKEQEQEQEQEEEEEVWIVN